MSIIFKLVFPLLKFSLNEVLYLDDMMIKCHQHRLIIEIVHVATKIDIEHQDKYKKILRKFITSQNILNLTQCSSAIEKGKINEKVVVM